MINDHLFLELFLQPLDLIFVLFFFFIKVSLVGCHISSYSLFVFQLLFGCDQFTSLLSLQTFGLPYLDLPQYALFFIQILVVFDSLLLQLQTHLLILSPQLKQLFFFSSCIFFKLQILFIEQLAFYFEILRLTQSQPSLVKLISQCEQLLFKSIRFPPIKISVISMRRQIFPCAPLQRIGRTVYLELRHVSITVQSVIVLIFNSSVIIIQMGNTQIEQKQELMFQNYTPLGEEGRLKLFQQKGTRRTFALQEDCFANKMEYDMRFKKLAQRQSLMSDNILQLVKLWSKQHNGICSHLYKIYALYEYPQVKLIDEIQARKRQGKYFEEVELFSIIQSCLNAISVDSSYLNLSPNCIFILPEGLLKLVHPQLIDRSATLMYDEKYYYSPEKMANFGLTHESFDQMQKQAIFSLGMTILHCVLLQSPKFCYQISFKRFNYRKLQVLLSEVASIYSPQLHHLLSKMLSLNPLQRLTFDELQTSLNSFFSNGVSLVSSLYRSNCQHAQPQLKLALQKQNDILHNFSSGKTSLQTLNRVVGSSKEDMFIHIPKEKPQFEELALKEIPFIKERPSYHMGTQSLKKASGKQNLYSDSKILEMIREGMEKINSSNKHRDKNSLSIVQNRNQFITFSQCKPETSNPIEPLLQSSEPKPMQNNNKCTFVIQTYHDQTHFEGMLCNNVKQGYGKLTYPDGVYYEGNFEKDSLHGRGSLYYGVNRPAYIGQWNHNKFHGQGVLYNEFPTPLLLTFNYKDFNKLGQGWIKYQGEFIQDIKCGKGRIILSNGQLMQGVFEKGLLNGSGTFTDLYGRKIQGLWKDNVMVE